MDRLQPAQGMEGVVVLEEVEVVGVVMKLLLNFRSFVKLNSLKLCLFEIYSEQIGFRFLYPVNLVNPV